MDEELSVLVAPALVFVAALLFVVLVVAECNFGVAVWQLVPAAAAAAVAGQLAVGVTVPKENKSFQIEDFKLSISMDIAYTWILL